MIVSVYTVIGIQCDDLREWAMIYIILKYDILTSNYESRSKILWVNHSFTIVPQNLI